MFKLYRKWRYKRTLKVLNRNIEHVYTLYSFNDKGHKDIHGIFIDENIAVEAAQQLMTVLDCYVHVDYQTITKEVYTHMLYHVCYTPDDDIEAVQYYCVDKDFESHVFTRDGVTQGFIVVLMDTKEHMDNTAINTFYDMTTSDTAVYTTGTKASRSKNYVAKEKK